MELRKSWQDVVHSKRVKLAFLTNDTVANSWCVTPQSQISAMGSNILRTKLTTISSYARTVCRLRVYDLQARQEGL